MGTKAEDRAELMRLVRILGATAAALRKLPCERTRTNGVRVRALNTVEAQLADCDVELNIVNGIARG